MRDLLASQSWDAALASRGQCGVGGAQAIAPRAEACAQIVLGQLHDSMIAHGGELALALPILGRAVLLWVPRPGPNIRNVTTTLITGGNRGLGRETARRLVEAGHDVWLAARDAERGRAAAQELGARFVELDVTDERSVRDAAERVAAESGGLDVLINNAGIGGDHKPVADVTASDLERVFDTNVFGIVRMTRAFLPLLERSDNPVVVNVSSGMGSLTVTSDPARIESTLIGLPYPASKTAVNMLTSQYAKAYPQMRINAVDPGYTATDFNGHRGTKSVEQGAEIIVRMARADQDAPTGAFMDENGPVPW
jgi:NAD(P)-dependent dehydrogenase (short-subunit alcohol dehydrogenase family)